MSRPSLQLHKRVSGGAEKKSGVEIAQRCSIFAFRGLQAVIVLYFALFRLWLNSTIGVFFTKKGKQCRVVRRGEKEEAPPEDGRTDRRSGRSAIHPNLVTNWRGKGGEILRVQKTRLRGQRKPSKKPSLSSSSLFFSSRAQKTGAFLFIPSLSLPRSRE